MNRRRFLAGSSAGALVVTSGCIERIQAEIETDGTGNGDYPAVDLDRAPEPYEETESTSNDSDRSVYYSTHLLGYDGVPSRIEEYNEQRDPTILYKRALTERLEDEPERNRFDLQVSTLGERTHVESREGRDIYAFKPTESEVDALREFGEVTYVPDLTTAVSLADVAREDVPRVAALPFVLLVNYAADGGDGGASG